MLGYMRKLKRFFATPDGRAVILPLDHGSSEGIPSAETFNSLLKAASDDGVQGLVLNKGMARAHSKAIGPTTNLLVQLSGGTKHGLPTYNKSIVCSVPEALRLGADAVCVQVNIGNDLEDRMLTDFGIVTDEAHQLGLPVMVVIYARGGQIVDGHDPSLISHCIRLGGELGADIVSVPYSRDKSSFAAAVAACPVPVLVTGGSESPDFDAFLKNIQDALDCGAAGVNIGRNLYHQPDPVEALRRIARIVHAVDDDQNGSDS